MKNKLPYILLIIFGLVFNVSAITYNYGESNGHLFNSNSLYSLNYVYGRYLPFTCGEYYISENNTLYCLDTGNTNILSYDLIGNITVWNITNPMYDSTNQPLLMYKENNNIVLYNAYNITNISTLDGSVISNIVSPYYYDSVKGIKEAGSPIYNTQSHLNYYTTDSICGCSGQGHRIFNLGFDYYNGTDLITQPSLDLISYGITIGGNGYNIVDALNNKMIYDKDRHYVIQVSHKVSTCGGCGDDFGSDNKTVVIKEALNIPATVVGKSCWINSSCSSSGSTGYYMACSKTNGNVSNTCDTDLDCSAPTSNCNMIDSLGQKYCTNDNTSGVCQINLNNPCIIDVPVLTTSKYAYDNINGEFYTSSNNGTHTNIYYSDVDSCEYSTQTNLSVSLLGSYESNGNPTSLIIDNQNIYFTTYNSTSVSYKFIKIRRSNGVQVYGRELTKTLYNGSLGGYAVPTNIEYDTISGSVYILVDTDKVIKFENLDYNTCPFEDVHLADKLCYTNGIMDLINHQYCDTSVNPTDTQPCVNKINLYTSCDRDWECASNYISSQGYCDKDFSGECQYTDSYLTYNCSCGKLSWETADSIPSGFWFYQITHGTENSLFDTYSVSTSLDTVIYNQSQTSLNISLNDSMFYRVSAVDNYAKIYWKSDIIAGSAGTSSTTTTTLPSVITTCALNITVQAIDEFNNPIPYTYLQIKYCPDVEINKYSVSKCSNDVGNMYNYYSIEGSSADCYIIDAKWANSNGSNTFCVGSYYNESIGEFCFNMYNIYTGWSNICIPIPEYQTTLINTTTIPDEILITGETIYNEGVGYYCIANDYNRLGTELNYTLVISANSSLLKVKQYNIRTLDYDTDLPIENVSIRFTSPYLDTIIGLTDSNGFFNVSFSSTTDLLTYTVYVYKSGYRTPEPYTGIVDWNLIKEPMYFYLSNESGGISYSISGYVFDNMTGLPINRAMVGAKCLYPYDVEEQKIDMTDSSGYYNLSNIRQSTSCKVYASYTNYNTGAIEFALFNDTIYNFSIERMPSTFSVQGKVSYNGLPLAGVNVNFKSIELSSYSVSDTTDRDGNYYVSLRQGNYTLTGTKSGYTTYTLIPFEVFYDRVYNFDMSSLSETVWLKGRCVEVDSNYNKLPINCSIEVMNLNNILISGGRFDSSLTQIGYFSQRIPSGYYNIKATYRGISQLQKVYVNTNMDFNDLIFEFKTTTTTIWNNFDELLQFFSTLMIFLQMIMIFFFLAVMSVLIATIATGGSMIYRRRRR
jgi:hypothetical protein